MRSLLAALFLVLLVAPPPARAADLRFLGGLDFFGVNQPGSASPAAAEVGLLVRGDLLNLKDRFDVRLSFQDREALVGNISRHELRELSFTARRLFGVLDLTVGRLPVAGGFWLFADGGAATLHIGKLFSVQAYGGLRAYTGGRVEADLRSDPFVLPLAGAALRLDHPIIHASLSYTFTRDVIELQRGLEHDGAFAADGNTLGTPILERSTQDEHFLDGQFVLLPHPKLFFTGGLTLGSRYEIQYSSAPGMAILAPEVVAQTLSSFMGYLIAEWRPVKRLRLSYSFDFDRVKVFSAQSPLDNALPTDGASFQDHIFKGSFRVWRALRLDARYRLRARDNGDLVHRVEAGASGDGLLRGFGAFFTLGADVYQGDRPVTPGDRSLVLGNKITYSGGLSYVRPWLDARAGVLYTDAIGSGVAFSTHAKQAMDAGPTTELFPLVLEAQRIAYVRGFTMIRQFFGGLDLELSLDGQQVRALVQVGYAR